MEKLFIQNRKGQKVVVVIDKSSEQKGLVFVMHGLTGNKEEVQLQTVRDAFLEKNFTVIRFDTTNTLGESDGDHADATVTNYYEDLEDVIGWAKGQAWFKTPFALVGHSLGGICTALYAEHFPNDVLVLAPLSTVVSGQLSIEAREKYHPGEIAEWKETGWEEWESESKPGFMKRLKWSHMEDRVKYNLLPEASKLTMPKLFVVGSEDQSTPPDHQKILYEAVPEPKEIHIIQGSPHTFTAPEHLAELKQIFENWIDSWLG